MRHTYTIIKHKFSKLVPSILPLLKQPLKKVLNGKWIATIKNKSYRCIMAIYTSARMAACTYHPLSSPSR